MKPALCFLAGSLFSASVVFISPSKPAILIFLGAALSLVTVAALVWFAGIPRTVRVLNSLASVQTAVEPARRVSTATRDEAKTKAYLMPDRSAYIKPSRKQQEQNTKDTVYEILGDDAADELFGVSPSRRAS